MIIIESGG